MDAGTKRSVAVRSQVALDAAARAAIAARLGELLGEPVVLAITVDPQMTGAVLYLDERREIVIDTTAPVTELGERLERALGAGAALEAPEVRRLIAAQSLQAEAVVGDTALKRALEIMRGSRVRLRTRVPVADAVVQLLRRKLAAAAGREIEVTVTLEPRLEVGAVLELGEDQRVVLDSRYAWLRDVTAALASAQEAGEEVPDPYEHLTRIMRATAPELRIEKIAESGHVLEVGDGTALVSGMGTVGSQEIVEFANGAYGIAFSLLKSAVGCLLLGGEEDIREGSAVRRTGHLLKVPVGPGLAGRIVDALGRPIDGRGPVPCETYRPVERKAPGVVERRPVDRPLHTGLLVIDALVPLGRGQRELIIGDRAIGKTSIALDTVISQRGAGVSCVWASVGQKASSVARLSRTLSEFDAMEYTTLVVALPGEQPAFRYITPYAACTMGEFVMDGGGDALVVYDDLSKHAVTYRELSALLKRPIGREAYPGDIFYVHSRLLERAARLAEEAGGGSLTALPIVETLAGDIAAFIPTNIISICDGQIMLDAGKFNEGMRPAMDVGLSVSRVGGAAQTALMKQVAGRLRIDLAQYEEMEQFVKFGAEVDTATIDQLARGERCREALRQPLHGVLTEAEEIAVLYAVVEGLADRLATADLGRFVATYIETLRRAHPDLLARLSQGERMDDALAGALGAVIDACAAPLAVSAETAEPGLGLGDTLTGEEVTGASASRAGA